MDKLRQNNFNWTIWTTIHIIIGISYFYYWWQWKMCRMLKIKKTEIVCITIWSFYGHYREYKLAIHIFKYYTKTIKGDTMTGSFVLCLSIYICYTWIVGYIFQTWYKMKSMTGLHIFVQIKSFYDFGHIGRDIVTKVHHIYIPYDSSRNVIT